MKTEKERYEAPTIQIVDVQTRGFLCDSGDVTKITMYLISQPPLPPVTGGGGEFGDTWGWD